MIVKANLEVIGMLRLYRRVVMWNNIQAGGAGNNETCDQLDSENLSLREKIGGVLRKRLETVRACRLEKLEEHS